MLLHASNTHLFLNLMAFKDFATVEQTMGSVVYLGLLALIVVGEAIFLSSFRRGDFWDQHLSNTASGEREDGSEARGEATKWLQYLTLYSRSIFLVTPVAGSAA